MEIVMNAIDGTANIDETKKYSLTKETKTMLNGVVVHRIMALRDIPKHGVKAGDKGGFIESEDNLSHYGSAWVSGNAFGEDKAWITDDALVSDSAIVIGKA